MVLTQAQTQAPAATTTQSSPDQLAAHQVSAPQPVPCSSQSKAAVLAWVADLTRQATGPTRLEAGHLLTAEVLAALATPAATVVAQAHRHPQTTAPLCKSEPVASTATRARMVVTGLAVEAAKETQNIEAAPMAFTSTHSLAPSAGSALVLHMAAMESLVITQASPVSTTPATPQALSSMAARMESQRSQTKVAVDSVVDGDQRSQPQHHQKHPDNLHLFHQAAEMAAQAAQES